MLYIRIIIILYVRKNTIILALCARFDETIIYMYIPRFLW